MGGQRQRNRRVDVVENNTFGGEPVEVRCLRLRIGAEGVDARGVERDQQARWTFGGSAVPTGCDRNECEGGPETEPEDLS